MYDEFKLSNINLRNIIVFYSSLASTQLVLNLPINRSTSVTNM
jgi:hypothetical protein